MSLPRKERATKSGSIFFMFYQSWTEMRRMTLCHWIAWKNLTVTTIWFFRANSRKSWST